VQECVLGFAKKKGGEKMKLIIVLLLAMVLIGCATVPKQPEMVAQNRVWCCCQTASGTCCGWVVFCPGYIPGCMCSSW